MNYLDEEFIADHGYTAWEEAEKAWTDAQAEFRANQRQMPLPEFLNDELPF